MADRNRLFTVTLVLGDGNLAAGAGKAVWAAQTRCRILECELALRTTGSVSGNTDVSVKKGGSNILTAPGLRIAQGTAAPATVRATPTAGLAGGAPTGVPLEAGDVVTVDIDAVPGTVSAGGVVTLLCQAIDI